MGEGRRRKIAKDVEKAFTNAVRQTAASTTIRSNLGDRIEAEAVGRALLQQTVSNFVQEHAKQALCSKGYATSVTCQRDGDNHVDFIFEVNRRRVLVGVSISF